MKKYQLIWSDEFDYEGRPDPKKWVFDIGGHGWGNQEAQYYTDSHANCMVHDGRLIITARKEKIGSREYSSAKIHTYGRFSFQYGRLEVKAKLPKGKGTWPAIWLLGDNIHQGTRWPLCGEIDLMEHVGRNLNKVIFSLHSQIYNHKQLNHRTCVKDIEDVSESFKEYAMEWDEKSIRFFVDGKDVVCFYRGDRLRDDTVSGWPFDQPFHLLLNLAIGGTWGGEIDDTIFPVSYEIEYVRIYKTEG